ncbi:MAG: hypothetical protein ACOYL5_01730 [Phototrophicaceae bacterium]|jgi:hypothetical protein
MTVYSRRHFLTLMGALALPPLLPGVPSNAAQLQSTLEDLIGSRNIGVAVGRYLIQDATLIESYRVGINADALRPTASCFKAWIPAYYYTFMPPELWDDGEGAELRSVVQESNNTNTGRILALVGEQQAFGNALEKFNDFLLYGLKLQHGISSWNWPNNPLEGVVDDRFSSGEGRMVAAGGELHAVGNVTTATDTLNGYQALLTRSLPNDAPNDFARRQEAALRTLDLLALSSTTDYLSPIERILGKDSYTGKDGVLPAEQITTGRVINDAGIIPLREGVAMVSFFSVGESEYSAVEILRGLIAAIFALEDAT